MVVQGEELVVVKGNEPDLEVVQKPDDRLQRRQRTRKVHRMRAGVAKVLERRAQVHTRRATRARKRRRFSPALSSGAKALRNKALGVSRRFHIPVTVFPVPMGSEHDGNGE